MQFKFASNMGSAEEKNEIDSDGALSWRSSMGSPNLSHDGDFVESQYESKENINEKLTFCEKS